MTEVSCCFASALLPELLSVIITHIVSLSEERLALKILNARL